MKKTILILAAIATVFTSADLMAKKKKTTSAKAKITLTDSQDINDIMKFDNEAHNFGTIEEGGKATHVFKFVNYGKEPLVIQTARASCGCTTPSYSKEPVMPGASGELTAVYNTKGRPGTFNKSVTITTNKGKKIVKISGKVNPQPKTSAPKTETLIKK